MGTSYMLAEIIGPLYLAIGLGLLLSKDHYMKLMKGWMNDTTMLYIGGIMAMLFGLLIVRMHNIWEGGWPILITIIGWAALLKGFFLLAAPDRFVAQFKNWKAESMVQYGSWTALALGAFLTYMGYMA